MVIRGEILTWVWLALQIIYFATIIFKDICLELLSVGAFGQMSTAYNPPVGRIFDMALIISRR